jgi:hypothetical protein
MNLGSGVCVLTEADMLVGWGDGLHTPWAQSTCQLLFDGELNVSVDGCCVCICCAKEFLIPKEFPIVLTTTRVQNSIAKKLPIFFLLVLPIFVVFV